MLRSFWLTVKEDYGLPMHMDVVDGGAVSGRVTVDDDSDSVGIGVLGSPVI